MAVAVFQSVNRLAYSALKQEHRPDPIDSQGNMLAGAAHAWDIHRLSTKPANRGHYTWEILATVAAQRGTWLVAQKTARWKNQI